MQIQIRGKQVEVDQSVAAHVERRLQFGLGRLSSHIRRVSVHIEDLNGPRGGEDKSCKMEIALCPTGRVFVEDTSADLYAAVDRATDRAARAVCRAVERAREFDRDTHPPADFDLSVTDQIELGVGMEVTAESAGLKRELAPENLAATPDTRQGHGKNRG